MKVCKVVSCWRKMKVSEEASCSKIDESEWRGELFEDRWKWVKRWIVKIDESEWRGRMFEGIHGMSSDHDESEWRDQVIEYIR